jgi:hypothetical protein
MSAVFRTDKRKVTVGPAPAGAGSRRIAPDAYLTDETFLYRVVAVIRKGEGEVVELEDCYWLDVVRIPVRHLATRRLRVVTPAHA